MIGLVLQKLYKRYCPDEAGALPQRRMCDIEGCTVTYKFLVKSSYLDPRFRDDLKTNDVTCAKEQLIEEYSHKMTTSGDGGDAAGTSRSGESTQQPPTKKTKTFASVFAKLSGGNVARARQQEEPQQLSPREVITQEMARFEGLTATKDSDVLIWYKDHERMFPILADFAKKYLCATGTSTPSERLFSTGGNIVTDLRTCLTGENAEMLIFLSMNKDIVPKPK